MDLAPPPPPPDLKAFAQAVEARCGLPPGAALKPSGDKLILLRAARLTVADLHCLLQGLNVEEVRRRGVKIAIVGGGG